jgi:hypothetical protein
MAIESEDFVLWTDLHEPEGRMLMQDLESFRQALVDNVFIGAARPVKKGLVVALADSNDWIAFGKSSNIAGFFMGAEKSPYRTPALFLPSKELVREEYRSRSRDRVAVYEARSNATETRQHELTHMMLDALVTDTPPWFNEGLAQYFESAQVDTAGQTVTFGAMPESMKTRLRRVQLLEIDEVVHAARGTNIHNASFYTTSQLLVSFLFNEHPDELGEYVRALKAAPREGRQKVWDQVFASYPVAEVQSDLAAWLRQGKVHVFQVRLAPHATRIEAKGAVSDVDLYGSRALLYGVLGGDAAQPEILENLRSCVAGDRTHVSCNLYLAALDGGALIDTAAIVAAHPDDWRAWLLAALSSERKHETEQRIAATLKMCEILGDEAVPDKVRALCKADRVSRH